MLLLLHVVAKRIVFNEKSFLQVVSLYMGPECIVLVNTNKGFSENINALLEECDR